LNNLTQFIIEN